MREVRGSRIAMIFQEPATSLNPVLTLGEQIAEPMRYHRGMARAAAAREAERLLDLVGIPDARRRLASYPHQLSGGMRQRAMIAIALACEPAVLIADEPTTALDVTVQAQILELLRELQVRTGMALMFITHNLGVVAEIADKVVVLYAGRVVEQAPLEPLFRRPLMPYTSGLLRSVPRLTGLREPLTAIPGNVPDPARLPDGCSFAPRCDHVVAGRCDAAVPELEAADAEHRRALRPLARDDRLIRCPAEPSSPSPHFASTSRCRVVRRSRRAKWSRPWMVFRSLSPLAKCWGWWENQAPARRHSGARCCACSSRVTARSASRTATSRICRAARCGRYGARCSLCSRIRSAR